ncbi:DUF4913 domain-containing protein [Nocardia sp. CA-120079]|uniref:DUF4913 domain-containing protein n=1 Tax=Nocardia sp. CA-120079 TaxID=3239974 RepID=UPI003D981796
MSDTSNGTETEQAAPAPVIPQMDLGELLDEAVRKAVGAQVSAEAKAIAAGVVADLLTPEVRAGMLQTAINEATMALTPGPEPAAQVAEEVEPAPVDDAGADDAEDEEEQPELHFRNLEVFVENYLAHVYRRQVSVEGSQRSLRWCPHWWAHGEVVSRLEALWRAFEEARHGEGAEMATWWPRGPDDGPDPLHGGAVQVLQRARRAPPEAGQAAIGASTGGHLPRRSRPRRRAGHRGLGDCGAARADRPQPCREAVARVSAPARSSAGVREQDSLATVTAALEQVVGPGRPAGSWTRYCCPVHEADGRHHNPSLIVKHLADAGRTKVQCRAGCDDQAVLDKLGLKVRDLYDTPITHRTPGGRQRGPRVQPRPVSRADRALDAAGLPLIQPKKPDLGAQTSPWKTVSSYPYVRDDGVITGEVVRQEADFAGGRGKQFHQRHWNPRSGRMEKGGFEPIPYRLPQLLETIAAGGVVYVCEGEKDVAAAESAGLTATTNAGGASSWSAEHAQWLRGARTVVIVADRDTAGYRRAERVMGTLAGLVQRVRIVQAATGKDLHDHLQCGHEIGELEPIPHLDPLTPGRNAAPAPTTSTPAAETSSVSAASSITPATSGGTTVPEHQLAPQLHDAPAPHGDEVDHIGSQWANFVRLLMTHLLEKARKQAELRRRLAERNAQAEEDERREAEARIAVERAAVEVRLRKLRERGFENASRTEIADAVADAAAWSDDSQVAKQALQELGAHVQQRYGVRIDAATGHVVAEAAASPELAGALALAEQDRAALARLRKAQDRMVELIAQNDALEQSVKEELYAEIEAWRANPTAKQLDTLSKKLADKGVGEQVRVRIRFVATYIGTPGQLVPVNELGTTGSLSPTTELRKLDTPLVDPGEEAKPRIDALLVSYQDRLRLGAPTAKVRAQLAQEMQLLTPEEQQQVRDRGNAIRKDPTARFAKLWADHVDRDELATEVRMYATLAPQAELAAGKASNLDDPTAAGLAKAAARHRKVINHAINEGQGLHPLEKDQLAAVLRDVEAGKTTTPELLFADERSGAAVDADKASRIAHDTSRVHRRQLDQILESNQAPAGTVRRTRDAVTKVMDAQTQLARGHASLPDYERTGVDRQLDAHLTAAGVPEPVRNQVRAHLSYAAGEAATAGKQANRIADRWAERTEAVAAARTPATPAYDSPERRAGLESDLRARGLDDDEIAQRMAADAGHAKPPSAAVRGAGRGKKRTTQQGAGVHRTYHRPNGRGPEHGIGL